jgi:DNA-binding response OmpR family regulator
MPVTAASAGLRVLVVDETRAERRAVVEALRADGMTALEAADGEQALAYARRLRPDVIVTDVAMPKLDASGLLQAIAVEGLQTRVVIRTRQTDEELRAWLLELGAADVVGVETATLGGALRAAAASTE